MTGWTGFTGRHLCSLLLARGHRICGISSGQHSIPNIEEATTRLEAVVCDLLDRTRLEEILREFPPSTVFHLAAYTGSRQAEHHPQTYMNINVIATINLLEAIRASGCNPTVLVTGSSAQFGALHERENPITETAPYNPLNLYAVSKIAQAMVALQYYNTYGMKIIRTHTFNCIGPGQPDSQIPKAFLRGIAKFLNDDEDCIRVGRLDTTRDFIDIRDAVRAYLLLAEQGTPGEVYNVCSARGVRTGEILERLLDMAGLSGAPVVSRLAGGDSCTDVPYQVGSYRKLQENTGWTPEISLDDSLNDMLSEQSF